MKFSTNTWVWVSPLTTDRLRGLAPHIAELGFDWIELPLEGVEDIDYGRAREIIRDSGLDVSACVVMAPDRDLIHPDETIRANGMAYVRHCIDALDAIGGTNLVGPIYAVIWRPLAESSDALAIEGQAFLRERLA